MLLLVRIIIFIELDELLFPGMCSCLVLVYIDLFLIDLFSISVLFSFSYRFRFLVIPTLVFNVVMITVLLFFKYRIKHCN